MIIRSEHTLGIKFKLYEIMPNYLPANNDYFGLANKLRPLFL